MVGPPDVPLALFGKCHTPLTVAVAQVGIFACVRYLFCTVLAEDLEQPVAHHAGLILRHHQRPIDQAPQQVDDLR